MKAFNRKLWTALTSVFCVLLIVVLIATMVANHFATSINSFLLCDTYKVIHGSSGEDTDYFPDAWAGYDDWFSYYEEDLCTRTEAEGAVLLMNNGALPLSAGARVSLFSHSSVDFVYGGTGSGSVNTAEAPTIRKSLEAAGAEVNSILWSFYNTGNGSGYRRGVPSMAGCAANGDYSINEVPWSLLEKEPGLKDTFSQYGDAAIFVLARTGGEGTDLNTKPCLDEGTGGDYLALSSDEKDTLRGLKALKDAGVFRCLIVLMDSSNAMNCDFVEDPQYGIDACLWVGGVGAYGNNAVADILLGRTNPSGRLVDTYLMKNSANPSVINSGEFIFPNAAEMGLTDHQPVNQTNVSYVVYQEGIYVGYKYFETRYEDAVMGTGNAGDFNYSELVYRSFGYGQSYTAFDYSGFAVKEGRDAFEVTVTVRNSGAMAGKHTVEVYMQKPYTDYDRQNRVEKSAVELVGFEKTALLSPGQAETVTVTVPRSLMKSYDAYGAGTYITDAGDYYLTVGTDAHNAVNNILAAKGYTAADGMDGEGNAALTWRYVQDSLDSRTYAVSAVTGNPIVNQFDHVDLNRYSGAAEPVTYLSRSDWEGTWPRQAVTVTLTRQMADDIRDEFVSKTADENGQPYEMPAYNKQNGLTLAMLMGRDYDDPAWEDLLDQMSFEEQENIIINGYHNTAVANSVSKPATVETNGPQGITDSFSGGSKSGLAYPAEVVMASTWNRAIMEEIGGNIGYQGLKTKTNGVYGPAANLHRNAYAGRNYEYFSEDAFLSGAMMAPEIAAIQSRGVYAFMKHFALNDQETNRAGVTVWANEQTIRETYLAAFAPSVTESHVKGAMTVMNRIGAEWGGASRALLTNVMRGEWGFDGIIITDYSSNSNYTLHTTGLEGGSDLWDGFGASAIADKANDPYVCQLMRQAIHRILYVLVNSSAMNGISSADRVVAVMPWWQVTLIAVDAVAAVLAAGSVVMLILSIRKNRAGNAKK